MSTSLSQAAPASHPITAEDRMERIGQLTAKQQTDALLWLAGYAPTVFDAVAEAVEPCMGDGTDDPAPLLRHLRRRHRHLPQVRPRLAALRRHRPLRHRTPRPRPPPRPRLALPGRPYSQRPQATPARGASATRWGGGVPDGVGHWAIEYVRLLRHWHDAKVKHILGDLDGGLASDHGDSAGRRRGTEKKPPNRIARASAQKQMANRVFGVALWTHGSGGASVSPERDSWPVFGVCPVDQWKHRRAPAPPLPRSPAPPLPRAAAAASDAFAARLERTDLRATSPTVSAAGRSGQTGTHRKS